MLGHLTYCSNIHPGETWPEVLFEPRRHLPAIKGAGRAPGSDSASGSGCRRSPPRRCASPQRWPSSRSSWAPTGSTCSRSTAFPTARFTASGSRSRSISPTGSTPERLAYTDLLADLLVRAAARRPGARRQRQHRARDLQAGRRGAGGGRADRRQPDPARRPPGAPARAHGADDRARARARALVPARDDRRDGCLLRGASARAGGGRARCASSPGSATGEAEAALRRHLGVCYDVCHAAVEFEDPAGSLQALRRAGIAVPKLQLSAALRIAERRARDRPAAAAVRRAGLPAPGGRARRTGG